MAQKVSIKVFVQDLEAALKRKDGYIMGATGQDPKKWATTSWWYTQYSGTQKEKALYWRKHAQRVWDCNGLAEGIYKDHTSVDINTKARYNYANWCSVKGTGMIPESKRVPGAAVFWGDTAASITHVAYLYKKTEDGKDWYLIEARGVAYGVVKTKLSQRKPKYWGIMDKYFDYSDAATPSPGSQDPVKEIPETGSGQDALTISKNLKKGVKGDQVTTLQKCLLALGYSLPKYGADGDFGNETLAAVKAFQQANGLAVDGIVGKNTVAKINQLMART